MKPTTKLSFGVALSCLFGLVLSSALTSPTSGPPSTPRTTISRATPTSATNGVLRNLGRHKHVLAYKHLSPEEIDYIIHALPYPPDQMKHLEDAFRGVDGRSVTEVKDLLYPSLDILAPRDEHRDGQQRLGGGRGRGGDDDEAISRNPNVEALARRDDQGHQSDCILSCRIRDDCAQNGCGSCIRFEYNGIHYYCA